MAKKVTEFKMTTNEKIGVISENGNSTLELRLVAWNDGDAKYDIRSWWTDDKGIEKCGKGVRLTKEELTALAEAIKDIA